MDGPVDVAGVAVGDVTDGAVGPMNGQAVQPTQANCNCLTKQRLDDGSLLFRDICTKEAVLGTPAEVKALAKILAR